MFPNSVLSLAAPAGLVLAEGGVLVANRDEPKQERPRIWAEDRGPISGLLTVPASFKAKYNTQV